jgi:hypothetical protein
MPILINPIFVGLIIGIFLGVFLIFKFPNNIEYKKIKKIIPHLRFVSREQVYKELKNEGIELDENSRCSVCGIRIRPENFGAVRKRNDKKVFVCNKSHCMNLGDIITTK